jgi:hypothetical protein
MKRAFTLAAALCVLALGAVSPASARAATYSTTCPAYSQLIAYNTYLVTGDPVTGADPTNVWATATYTRTVQIYKVSGNTYCAVWRDTGTFTTLGGTSPAGTGTVDAGITGRLTRSRVETFTGTWSPTGATGPFAGPFDVLSLYFTDVSGVTVTWYADIYTTTANGSWGSRSGYPSYCDIRS